MPVKIVLMKNSYGIDEIGLLIGFISTPDGIPISDFFTREIEENLSKIYREGRRSYTSFSKDMEDDILYHPYAYRTFGDHNLTILSLIDDFSYPNRVFHPSHGSRSPDNPDYYNYDYQLVTCLNTLNSERNGKKYLLKDFFGQKSTVNREYPFICITRLKVSNYFLLGNGICFTELIKRKIYQLSENEVEGNGKLEVIVLDSQGSEEMTIVGFSSCFSKLARLVNKVRSLRIGDLSLTPEDDKLYMSVLANMVLPAEVKMKYGEEWRKEAHVFSAVYSLPGYEIGLSENDSLHIDREDSNVEVSFHFIWDIKPGHAVNFKEEFENLLDELPFEKEELKEYKKQLNTEPLRLNNSSWEYKYIYPGDNPDHAVFNVLNLLRNFDRGHKHVRKLHMKLEINDIENKIFNEIKAIPTGYHPQIDDYCKNCIFDQDKLSAIRINLEKAKVSKLLRERILKMYNNYNNCIKDPMFFVNFIDLHRFLVSFMGHIHNYANCDKVESSLVFHEWVDLCVSNFEQAYLNRFHQSNRMQNVSDFNIEWNGGIQQFISPIDFVYKCVECLRLYYFR